MRRSNELNDDIIKRAAKAFDSEGVTTLTVTGVGLSRTVGLSACTSLAVLDLSHNVITAIQGLEPLKQLRKLILVTAGIFDSYLQSHNALESLSGLPVLPALEQLDVRSNQLAEVSDLCLDQLAALPRLQVLLLQDLNGASSNPVCSQQNYKAAVLQALPKLTNLDEERAPASSSYRATAAKTEALRANPPPPRQYELPQPQPWAASDTHQAAEADVSKPISLVSPNLRQRAAGSKLAPSASGGRLGGSSSSQQHQHQQQPERLREPGKVLVKKLDEAHMLSEALDQQVDRLRAALG